jgi:hypothetical protein
MKGDSQMKRSYESPEILFTRADERDVITTSGGDTPAIDLLYEW